MNALCRLQMVSFNNNMKHVVLALKIVSLIRDKPKILKIGQTAIEKFT